MKHLKKSAVSATTVLVLIFGGFAFSYYQRQVLDRKHFKEAEKILCLYERTSEGQSKVARAIKTVSDKKEQEVLTSRYKQVLSAEKWKIAVENEAVAIILKANAEANAGKPNMFASSAESEIREARTESQYNNSISDVAKLKLAHNYIPSPGSQNVAGGEKIAYLFTIKGAKEAARDLTGSFLDEKRGYDLLKKAGYSAQEIQYEGASLTDGHTTYSFKGMDGTGFEKSSVGGVVGHYLMIANQNPSQLYDRFSVGVYYNVERKQIFETVDFWLPETKTVKNW